MMAFLRMRFPWIVMILAALVIVVAAVLTYTHREPQVVGNDGVPGSTPASAQPPPLDVAALTVAPETLGSLTPDQARMANASLPFSTLPIEAARPFFAPSTSLETYARALDCMTAAIYYEAGIESAEGQQAVAQVVINRMRHPAYPNSVCGVVFEGSERQTGCQFTFTCSGAMARPPWAPGWARARTIAGAALNGTVLRRVGMATHYHTDWVYPYWGPRLTKLDKIGTHIFYRWPGEWGRPRAFGARYAGEEPVIAKMSALASLGELPEPELAIDIASSAASEPETVTIQPIPQPRVATVAPVAIPVLVPSAEPSPPPSREAPPPAAENPLARERETNSSQGQRRIPLPNQPGW